jgi:hypothetical protein
MLLTTQYLASDAVWIQVHGRCIRSVGQIWTTNGVLNITIWDGLVSLWQLQKSTLMVTYIENCVFYSGLILRSCYFERVIVTETLFVVIVLSYWAQNDNWSNKIPTVFCNVQSSKADSGKIPVNKSAASRVLITSDVVKAKTLRPRPSRP